jgi:lysophospholipase L1-like esterase
LAGWRGSALLAAIATIFSLGLVAIAGEIAVRHRERTRTTVPGTMSKLFYRHTRLMHALERGSDYYGWVHIGRQGFRGERDVSVAKPDSVFRIIAVGGSTTFDPTTSGDSSAWPARLERMLDSLGGRGRVEVLNAGVPGFQVFDDLVRLGSELHDYDPDLIVLYQGHNDLFNTLSAEPRPSDAEFDPRPGEIPTIYPWEHWLERNSLLYHKLGSKLQAMRFQSSGEQVGEAVTPAEQRRTIERGAEAFARTTRSFLAVANALGIRVVVPQVVYATKAGTAAAHDSVVVNLWAQAAPYAPPATIWSGYAAYDSVAQRAASSFGALYVPATDPSLWLLDGYAAGDPIHFNDEGARRLARHLAAAIAPLIEINYAAR